MERPSDRRDERRDSIVVTRQRGMTCGEANVKSVVDSLGVSLVADVRRPWTVRLFGYSLLRDIRRLLEAHGLKPAVRSAGSLSDGEKLRVLYDALDAGSPVILAIGNGHLQRGVDRAWARRLFGHYLTLYGYDREDETFFVYDSYLDGEPEQLLPIGNETRSAEVLLRDWRGPFYYRWIRRDHVFIEIEQGL
jgi:hypothetical protein